MQVEYKILGEINLLSQWA